MISVLSPILLLVVGDVPVASYSLKVLWPTICKNLSVRLWDDFILLQGCVFWTPNILQICRYNLTFYVWHLMIYRPCGKIVVVLWIGFHHDGQWPIWHCCCLYSSLSWDSDCGSYYLSANTPAWRFTFFFSFLFLLLLLLIFACYMCSGIVWHCPGIFFLT